jgi:spore maturation protein CgeB
MADACGWADFWSVALAKLGYEATDVIANAEPMQKAWARENGGGDNSDWVHGITAAQVESFAPDILFVNDYTTFTADYLRHLRSRCSSIRLVLGWCGAPYRDSSVFKECDIVLTNVPELFEDFIAGGHRCHLINHAFDARILERLGSLPADIDFSFIGTIWKDKNFHHNREQLLLDLVAQSNLQIFTDVFKPSLRSRLEVAAKGSLYDSGQLLLALGLSQDAVSKLPVLGRTLRWEARPGVHQSIDPRLATIAQPPVFGMEMFRKLQRCKISLNTHIDLSASHASNMRLYEATGVGSCLLTDWKPNLPQLFDPELEIVTYRNVSECLEKVRYLLDHERERVGIATAGQQRTLREHTFDNRAQQLDDLIRGALTAQ